MIEAEHNYTKYSQKRAKELRKEQTLFEQKVWSLLRNRNFMNLKFRRQVPIGNYIVDFACKDKKIIIELDGSGHMSVEQIAHDEERDKYLTTLGYRIIRIPNNVLKNIDLILEYIYNELL